MNPEKNWMKTLDKPEINIELLQLSDLDALMEIESTAYGPHHWSRESFVAELDNKIARYYGAKNTENELIGYIGVWNIVDETHITTIAVREDYRRKGIAESLIAKIIEDCYNDYIKYITLEVRASNDAAIGLYTKFGMHSLGTRKGYYQDNGEDALIMWSNNIFSDAFKELYSKNKEEIKQRLIIK